MRTQLLGGEEIFRTVEGSLHKAGVESKGTCYFTTRRLIFEEPDRKVPPKVKIDKKKYAKNVVAGGVLLGGLGGAYGATKSMEVEEGHIIPGTTIIIWFDQLTKLEVDGTRIEATLQKDKENTEQISFKVNSSTRLTREDQEKLKSIVQSVQEKARFESKMELGTEEKIAFLKENNAKKGFLRPEQKLEYDISRKMALGKTREKAIEELFDEATKSA